MRDAETHGRYDGCGILGTEDYISCQFSAVREHPKSENYAAKIGGLPRSWWA